MTADDAPALFDLADAAPPGGRAGRVERLLLAAIEAGRAAGVLIPEDQGMIGGALAGARGLDQAEALGPRGVYAVAQLLNPYREALAALRLPAAVAPAAVPAAGSTPHEGAGLPEWLSDGFGTPE